MDPGPFARNWHHDAIAEHLEAVSYGDIRRLWINIAPRHTKTLLCSVAWQVWAWIKKPDADYPLIGPQVKFMCLSYSDMLVMDNATIARRLIYSEWFQQRWGHRVMITEDQDNKARFDTTAGGSRISASFGGTVTGRGGDIRIIDDPHKVDEAESQDRREDVLKKYDGTLKSRITDPRTYAEVGVMQRLHENDLTGHVLEEEDPNLVHLMLPAEFDPGRKCVTSIGWEDPRQTDGELLWPERFGPDELVPYKHNPYEWSGQWQQMPGPRGGAIFQRDWWQLWDPPDGKFPPFDYIVASLDGAFTAREENDPSGLTVWGTFRDESFLQMPDGKMVRQENGQRKVMLIDAWRKHLPMHGPRMDPTPDEQAGMQSEEDADRRHWQRRYEKRCQPHWGLVEWLAHSCRRWRVDKLLIEAKGPGISAAQEMQRLYGEEQWAVQLEQVKGDKTARAHAVVPVFSQMLVYAPDRDWAEMVIAEMESFPRGRHDDLTDSATQALKHLRAISLIQHPEERAAEETRRGRYRKRATALYPV